MDTGNVQTAFGWRCSGRALEVSQGFEGGGTRSGHGDSVTSAENGDRTATDSEESVDGMEDVVIDVVLGRVHRMPGQTARQSEESRDKCGESSL